MINIGIIASFFLIPFIAGFTGGNERPDAGFQYLKLALENNENPKLNKTHQEQKH